jgi:phosphoglycerate dehydrogenase-like enzyme
MTRFLVGLTSDFFDAGGGLAWGDIGLAALDSRSDVEWIRLADSMPELSADSIDGLDAVLVNGPTVTAATVGGPRPPKVIARFGVGYDSVDVEACTRAGVLVTNTPDGVRRPVALSALTLLLALSHRLLAKDELVRRDRWNDRLRYRGSRITGATVGIVGLGNIGREILRLAAPLGMRHIAYDPYASAESAASVGAGLVDLPTLLQQADFVVVTVALTPETRGMLGAAQLQMMKPSAYFINLARGPVVDEDALVEVLQRRAIAGAGLDVFATEPLPAGHPLIDLDNVILTPHALCWTDELATGNGSSAIASILAVADGRAPAHVVNPAALASPRLSQLA